MQIDVKMPQMGESVTEGFVAHWLKRPGEHVEKNETLLEITTDKVDTEIPAPGSGTLLEILVPEGESAPVGAVLARLEVGGSETTEAHEEPERSGGTAVGEQAELASTATAEAQRGSGSGVATFREAPISPEVRNFAREHGISEEDLRRISGSGRGGRITRQDVLAFLGERTQAATAQPPPELSTPTAGTRRVPMTPVRKLIAEHMVRSKRTSPHTYTVAEVDLTRIVRFREAIKERFQEIHGFNLTYTPFILHATVVALKAHPLLNCSIEGDEIILHDYVHLGIAVALESGLIVPVIKQADEKNLLGLARAAHDLAVRARNRRLSSEDVQGGTFTVTNPGVFGNIFGLPIINQPQVAILGIGAVRKRPIVVQDDAIAVRSMMYLSLSYDHRAIDGAEAGRFLQRIRTVLEQHEADPTILGLVAPAEG